MNPRPQSATGSQTSGDLRCRVCGRLVERGSGRRPRELHIECKAFAGFWRAAQRRLPRVLFEPSDVGDALIAALRRELFAAANSLPARRARDARGRFRKEEPTKASRTSSTIERERMNRE